MVGIIEMAVPVDLGHNVGLSCGAREKTWRGSDGSPGRASPGAPTRQLQAMVSQAPQGHRLQLVANISQLKAEQVRLPPNK